jgi:hypothetical protein
MSIRSNNNNNKAVTELIELLNLQPSTNSATTTKAATSLASAVANVIILPSLPLSEKTLAGTWQVRDTVGKPNWQLYSEKLSFGQQKNRNFQIFGGTDSARRFVNLSEYAGSSIYATAVGTYSFLPPEKEKAKAEANKNKAKATVTGVQLHFGKFVLKLNVKGDGIVNVLFNDGDIRILQGEDGARAIQQKVEIPLEYINLLHDSSGLW